MCVCRYIHYLETIFLKIGIRVGPAPRTTWLLYYLFYLKCYYNQIKQREVKRTK